MTNEEKANEITKDYLLGHDRLNITYEEMLGACLDMAEWKDQQYTEIIKDECNNSYESGLGEGRRMVEEQVKEYLESFVSMCVKTRDYFLNKGDFVAAERFDTRIGCIQLIINELFKED